MTQTYDVVIGAKRQLTIPSGLFRELSLNPGDQLRLTLNGSAVLLQPMVTVPRHMISSALLHEMEGRRGAKPSDLTLSEFQARRREQGKSQSAAAANTAKHRDAARVAPGSARARARTKINSALPRKRQSAASE